MTPDFRHIGQLCRGVAAWNASRIGEASIPSLAHLIIRNADLRGADFRGVDFDRTRMTRVDLRGADLRGARLNGVEIEHSHFGGARLDRSELKGARFTSVCLRDASLDEAVGLQFNVRDGDLTSLRAQRASLDIAHFYNCDLSGADFADSQMSGGFVKRPRIGASCREQLEAAGCRIDLENEPRIDDWTDWSLFDVRGGDVEFGVIESSGIAYWLAEGRWDFFISHATEDKESIARPLAGALRSLRQEVWFDELSIKVGDSLEKRISDGMRGSIFGIAIASPRFFGRRWTEAELAMLEQKRMFIVLHEMMLPELAALRPSLADRLCLLASLGPAALAHALVDAARRPVRIT